MTRIANKGISGYILAGGKSSRMGSDKGLILLDNNTIIEYVITQLKPAVDELVIVSNNSKYRAFGYPVISDLIEDAGPAGGIHAALSHSKATGNFIVSCDMPYITTAAIEHMIGHSTGAQITVPVFREKLEPLFGVYATECAHEWLGLIQKGVFKLQHLIDHFTHHKLNVDELALFNENLFTNMNTREDLLNAVKKSKHGN